MSGQELIEFAAGAAVAFVGAWALYRLFAARETYFVWIMPLFLVTMFVGALGLVGGVRPLPAGALAGLIGGGAVLGWRSWQLQLAHLGRLENFARDLGLTFSRTDETYATTSTWTTATSRRRRSSFSRSPPRPSTWRSWATRGDT